MKQKLVLALVCSLFLLPLANADEDPGPGEDPVPGKEKCDKANPIDPNVIVIRGVDGDTIHVRASNGKEYAIRMIGMDTPETHYMGQSQGEWGEKAAARLKEYLPANSRVRLEFSPSICDSYGRYLAHVFNGKVHVNLEMAKAGLAVLYCLFPSVTYCNKIGAATRRAIEDRLGMFADTNVELPYDFRRRIAGREQTSLTGNLRTKDVFRPGHGQQERVSPGDRIFFSSESSVKAPYHVVD